MLADKFHFQIPDQLTGFIENRLRELNVDSKNFSSLAAQVKKLSDFYINNPSSRTPYSSPEDLQSNSWVEIASLIYFFPLNYMRNLKVFQEAERLRFLQGLDNIIEFGSGFGPSSWALKNVEQKRGPNSLSSAVQNFYWIESSPLAPLYASFYAKEFSSTPIVADSYHDIDFSNSDFKKTLAVFSYSLTELKTFPDWAEKCEAILILEPSTQDDGRRLQSLRPTLTEKGFSLWGPCMHEKECPLLKHSQRDWCHDRLLLQRPEWLERIESHLAWENKSLTFSYLLARKTPPVWKGKSFSHQARVIGDTLFEKGKTRQLLCKDDQRQFFAWLNKEGAAPELPRGSLVHWGKDEIKSNEIRPKSEMHLIEQPDIDA